MTAVLIGTALGTGTAAQRLGSASLPAVGLKESALIGVALILAGCLTVEVRHRGEIESFDVFEVALAPALFFLSGLEVVLLAVAAKVVSQLILRMPGIKLIFNAAQWAACAGAGALVFALIARLGHPQLGLAVAMTVVAGINLLALLGLFGMLDGWAAVGQLLRPRALQWSITLTGVSITAGLGITSAAVGDPTALLFVLALPVLLYLGGHGYALARADLDRIRSLQGGTRALSAVPDVRRDPAPFLSELANGCRALGAELALSHADGIGLAAYRYSAAGRSAGAGSDAEDTLTRMLLAERLPLHTVRQATSACAQRPHVLSAFLAQLRARLPSGLRRPPKLGISPGTTIGPALRAAGWRDCLAVPIRIDGLPVGMLAVYDRSGFADLDEADLATTQAFSREVAAALQRASLVDEILGARQDAARIVESSNDGIVTIADDGSVVTWNQAFVDLTGHAKERMLAPGGLALLDARDCDQRPVQWADWAQRVDTQKLGQRKLGQQKLGQRKSGQQEPGHQEVSVRAVDGGRRWLSCSFARTSRDDGDLRHSYELLVVIARDVTDLRRQRDLITGQSHVLELIAAGESLTSSLRSVANLVGRQLACSAVIALNQGGAGETLEVVAQTSSGEDARQWEGMATLPPIREVLEQLAGKLPQLRDRTEGVPVGLGRPGGSFWVLPVLDGQHKIRGAVIAARPVDAQPVDAQPVDAQLLDAQSVDARLLDAQSVSAQSVTPDAHSLQVLRTAARLIEVAVDRDLARERLTYQASHDPLTGLPNRTVFLDRCRHALQVAGRHQELAVVLFVDLDRFKVINDSLGHDAGDRLLIAVAERLRLAVRPSDTIARFGGDEFTILCEQMQTPQDARLLAERVLDLFAMPFQLDGREVFETASVGIALGRAPQRPEDLMQDADAAMYRAKASGGNRFDFFDETLRREAQERLADYAALRRAVEGNEFEVHYQPTFALSDGAPVGMEALARWRHPERGLLQPDSFIDLAEETGLIVPLGAQILTTVLKEMPAAQPGTRPLRVSVNLSARQLTQPDLAASVERALAEADVAPARLALEITESLLLTDSAAMQAVIGQLKQIGVDLSLDDFGTGHSSMDYLKFLPVDELKIERRFVAGLLSDRRDRAIVSAITHLAHDLGLRVVAEGIESADQAHLLRHLGCDIGQGYFYARPGPMLDGCHLKGKPLNGTDSSWNVLR